MRTLSKACVLFSVISSLLFFGCVDVSDPPDYPQPDRGDVAGETTSDSSQPEVTRVQDDDQFPETDHTPVLLARQQNVQDMVVDDRAVYWTTVDEVKGTGSVMMVVHGEQIARELATNTLAVGIATDKDYVYWADQAAGTIMRLDMTDGRKLRLVSGLRSPSYLTVSDDYVYFTDTNEGTINRISKTGSSVTVLAKEQDYPADIRLGQNMNGETELYWSNWGDSGTLMAMPLDASSPRVLVAGASFANGFVIDGTNILWTDPDARAVSLYSMQFNKSDILAGQQFTVAGLATDSNYVYWITQHDGAIHSLYKSTGSSRVLISGQDTPHKLVVSDSHIFWADTEYGSVFMLAK